MKRIKKTAAILLALGIIWIAAGGLSMAETLVNVNYLKILGSIGYSEKLIASGYMSPGMTNTVQAAEEAGTWLAKRYPDHEFEMIGAEPGSRLDGLSRFDVQAENGVIFHVWRNGAKQEDAMFLENYWGFLHREELNKWIKGRLDLLGVQALFPALEVYDRFGEECPPEATIAELFAEDRKIRITGRIYLPAEAAEDGLCDEIINTLGKYFLGSVFIFICDETFDPENIRENTPVGTNGLTASYYYTLETGTEGSTDVN